MLIKLKKKQIHDLIYNREVIIICSLPFILGFFIYFIESNFTLCPLMNLTNLPCPLCGIGRSFSELTHMDFIDAINYNLMITIMAPFLLLIIILQCMPRKIKRFVFAFTLKHFRVINILANLVFIMFLAYGILRISDQIFHFWHMKNITPRYTLLNLIRNIFR